MSHAYILDDDEVKDILRIFVTGKKCNVKNYLAVATAWCINS